MVKGRSPGSGSEEFRPPKLKQFAYIVYRILFTEFDCRNDQNLKISHN